MFTNSNHTTYTSIDTKLTTSKLIFSKYIAYIFRARVQEQPAPSQDSKLSTKRTFKKINMKMI